MREDFIARFMDLLNMEIPEWLISPFDVDVKSKNFLKRKNIAMIFDPQAKSMLIFRGIGYYSIKEKISQALCHY